MRAIGSLLPSPKSPKERVGGCVGRQSTINHNHDGAREGRSQAEEVVEREDCLGPGPQMHFRRDRAPSGLRRPGKCAWPGDERPLPPLAILRDTASTPGPGRLKHSRLVGQVRARRFMASAVLFLL